MFDEEENPAQALLELKDLINANTALSKNNDERSSREIMTNAALQKVLAELKMLLNRVKQLESESSQKDLNISQLGDRGRVLEVQRLALSLGIAICVPILFATLVSHYFNLHELEIGWVVVGCWLLFLYILLFSLIRMLNNLRKSKTMESTQQNEPHQRLEAHERNQLFNKVQQRRKQVSL